MVGNLFFKKENHLGKCNCTKNCNGQKFSIYSNTPGKIHLSIIEINGIRTGTCIFFFQNNKLI